MSNNAIPPITHEQIEALRERYTPPPVPPCRVCGSPLALASIGGGKAPEYFCSEAKFEDGETDFHHYRKSNYTHYSTSDSQVIAVLDALTALAPATSTSNTSGRGHCPHCGVCHTPDETCIQALQRLLLVTNKVQSDQGERAIAEYVADLKANLHPKETCPECSGNNDPAAQVDCVVVPCKIGRDFHRPPLEEVIQRIESLLTPGADAGSEVAVGTFDPDSAGCIRWKDGIVRGDFNEGGPFFCRTSVTKASDPTAS